MHVFTWVFSVANGTFSVPFRGPPRYNPKRRSAAWGGWWTAGDRSSLASSTRIPAEFDALLRRQGPAASPCSLERPFSSASSSISDASHPSHEDDASILTGNAVAEVAYSNREMARWKIKREILHKFTVESYFNECCIILFFKRSEYYLIRKTLSRSRVGDPQYFSLAKERALLMVIMKYCTKIWPRKFSHWCKSEH